MYVVYSSFITLCIPVIFEKYHNGNVKCYQFLILPNPKPRPPEDRRLSLTIIRFEIINAKLPF